MITLEKNPSVSVVLFTYNEERYVRSAIEALLAQEYSGRLEIIISDDCSQDQTFEIIKEAVADYNSPHKIILNRNEQNLGILAHYCSVFDQFVYGDIVIMHGGDDISLPGYIQTAADFFLEHPDCFYVSFAYEPIDAEGNSIGEKSLKSSSFFTRFCKEDYFAGRFCWSGGPASAIRREVMEEFDNPVPNPGAYQESLVCYRALCLGAIYYLNKKVIFYRKHSTSVSALVKPNNKPKITKRVYQQIYTDAACAYKKGIITQSEKKSLEQAVERERIYNKYRIDYEKSGCFKRSIIFFQAVFNVFLRVKQKTLFFRGTVLSEIKLVQFLKRGLKKLIFKVRRDR